jgi:hypothetical protein
MNFFWSHCTKFSRFSTLITIFQIDGETKTHTHTSEHLPVSYHQHLNLVTCLAPFSFCIAGKVCAVMNDMYLSLHSLWYKLVPNFYCTPSLFTSIWHVVLVTINSNCQNVKSHFLRQAREQAFQPPLVKEKPCNNNYGLMTPNILCNYNIFEWKIVVNKGKMYIIYMSQDSQSP